MARATRRPARAAAKTHRSPAPARTLLALATGRQARVAYMVVGSVGLAALALALVGPGRLQRRVVQPLRGAVEPQAEKLWLESKPLREQFAQFFKNASPSGRARLVRNFQSWIGHFHAT